MEENKDILDQKNSNKQINKTHYFVIRIYRIE